MVPDEHLTSTAVFHITHMENLARMLESERLIAKNGQSADDFESIANEEVQSRRAKIQVPLGPGGPIHDYVPFYFAPRSPMLFCNHKGSIPNAKPQREIITLVTTAQILAKEARPFVFYDRHAVVGYTQAYERLEDLKAVDWRIFFEPPLTGNYAKYWQDRNDSTHPHWVSRKEVRQAEFLVHEHVPFACIRLIGTYSDSSRRTVEEILKIHENSCPVETHREWYF